MLMGGQVVRPGGRVCIRDFWAAGVRFGPICPTVADQLGGTRNAFVPNGPPDSCGERGRGWPEEGRDR